MTRGDNDVRNAAASAGGRNDEERAEKGGMEGVGSSRDNGGELGSFGWKPSVRRRRRILDQASRLPASFLFPPSASLQRADSSSTSYYSWLFLPSDRRLPVLPP